jgi:hypothetical protein
MSLLEHIFPNERKNSVVEVMTDDRLRNELLTKAGAEIINSNRAFFSYPLEQIEAMSLQPDFAPLSEKYHIAGIITKRMNSIDVLPYITEHSGKDLAERCLLSVCFFYNALRRKENQYSAPSPEFYMKVGQSEFEKMHQYGISNNLPLWKDFWNDIIAA